MSTRRSLYSSTRTDPSANPTSLSPISLLLFWALHFPFRRMGIRSEIEIPTFDFPSTSNSA
ncbi:hypothetical protein LINPERPRIM_LOCUS37800 [Linum perenne]